MPFRERAKALFRPKPRSSDSDSSRKSSSVYYKPHEMPRAKYRTPATKEHKEHLESFSFSDAWRRKSFQSQYSPMGTRAPSRRNSFLSLGRRKSQRSVHSNLRHSRNNSITSGDGDKPGVRQRENVIYGAARATRLSTEIEAEGDDDIGNVGISRVQSRDRIPQVHTNHHQHAASDPNRLAIHGARTPPHATAGAAMPTIDTGVESKKDHHDSAAHLVDNTAHDHLPFTEHDLALALHRSHLAVPTQG